ncbi:MAG TPA: transposase [Candidatus Marinimicrobia bacterium]|nr:transposase [Candidatus Neomarinimicrobiota bacterium]HRS51973.1 transposase [Candidatus Neomarinimicrobiota bacterium]HRU91898.1 transposase [Candidatus Neomarinimicrobiota bacterium]
MRTVRLLRLLPVRPAGSRREGRSYQNIAIVLKRIKRKARLKIKWVSVDFLPALREQAGWKPYLKIVHQYFPNAQIILDKFHLTYPPCRPTGQAGKTGR